MAQVQSTNARGDSRRNAGATADQKYEKYSQGDEQQVRDQHVIRAEPDRPAGGQKKSRQRRAPRGWHSARIESFPKLPFLENCTGGKPQTFGIGVPKRIGRGQKKAREIRQVEDERKNETNFPQRACGSSVFRLAHREVHIERRTVNESRGEISSCRRLFRFHLLQNAVPPPRQWHS